MKKFLVVVLAIIVINEWRDIRNLFSPPPDFAAAHEERVVMYATQWCPFCQKARELFAEKGISYYEYDIEKSEEGNTQYQRLGASGVPILLINGEVLKGFNRSTVLALINEK
ncbi:glutaredoxin family protein [Neptunomonas qingdaonensis]|uniref:Glutaredoxin n=1 Tax=Neptunomonas qingdaonensis TaxID=1045558 RepID=A0A1I2S7M5_9GAMM|nr:glutaredoxin domain-containing protein [Neptunomonas qingdaonensis]SFG48842.1 Glutaredoxin [Neptunomonas qingdaonensis]